jgi:type II secretory pathway component GspD/PulD (secretin)
MNKHERQILTTLAVSWIAAVGSAPAQSDSTYEATAGGSRTAQAMGSHAIATTAGGNNSVLTTGPAEKGLILNLLGVPVDGVLKYLAEAAGFTIIREANTDVQGTVDIVSATPLSKGDLVLLVNKVLAPRGLTALQDGQTLTIMSVQDAGRFNLTPVVVWSNAAAIPQDARIVTGVISLHSLSPTQVVKDLSSLLPPEAGLVANEGGNAIILTARQADIRRFTQIIQALDSSGESDLEVFPLEYADSKAIAQELKDVFAAQDAGASQGNPFQSLIGNRGGGAARADTSRRAAIRVNAVSDDQDNALLVSAPADIMPGISNLIHRLDIPQDDVVQIRVFSLHHADATDVASQITSLFPDSTTQAGQQNNGRGPGAQFVAAQVASSQVAGLSERRKKQAAVVAVPDPRTQSVIITASRDTMAQIENIITELDSNAAGTLHINVYRPENADVTDLQGPMSDLFGSGSPSANSSQVNALTQRANQGAQSGSPTTLGTAPNAGGSSGGRAGP